MALGFTFKIGDKLITKFGYRRTRTVSGYNKESDQYILKDTSDFGTDLLFHRTYVEDHYKLVDIKKIPNKPTWL